MDQIKIFPCQNKYFLSDKIFMLFASILRQGRISYKHDKEGYKYMMHR